jgi:thiamine kinase-like enzyme
LISRNIMFDGEKFRLVDWPASGYGNPYWDFIDFVDFQSFNKQEICLFLTEYHNREITQEEWDLFVVLRPIPSIVRVIGGFAFMPDVKSKMFYDQKRNEASLITFNQLINDFALDKMNVEHWQVTMAFLLEAERQLENEEFKSSLDRLQKRQNR